MKREIDEIVEKYSDMLYRIAYLNLKVPTDAEDIVQEVFLRYIINSKEFNDEEHEKNWLIRVTLNLCKNLSKSGWIKHTVPIDNECLQIECEENHNELEELDNLKDIYKNVVQLFYYEDLSVESISKILNISEANVRTRLNRARQELKQEIERGDSFYG